MRFKLDENLGNRTYRLFTDAGHEVETVLSQGLQGSADKDLYEVCRSESYCLVTLDLDFSDVLRFPPASVSGTVILRCPSNASVSFLEELVGQFLSASANSILEGALWVVEPGRIRIYQPSTDELSE